jgi:hypothetical protein
MARDLREKVQSIFSAPGHWSQTISFQEQRTDRNLEFLRALSLEQIEKVVAAQPAGTPLSLAANLVLLERNGTK